MPFIPLAWIMLSSFFPLAVLILAELGTILFGLATPTEAASISAVGGMVGIYPLFFGILVALNLQTSFLTPPMAMSASFLKGVAPPEVQLLLIFRGVIPFLLMVFISMAIVYVFPAIVFHLPDAIYGR